MILVDVNLLVYAHVVSMGQHDTARNEQGLTLCSTDGDFARFPGLRWEESLQTPGH